MDTTKSFTTPTGYEVRIKTDLTYGEFEDIQSLMAESVKIDTTTGKPEAISMTAIKQANQKAVEFLLLSIVKDGKPIDTGIRNLPSRDGKVIMQEIDKIIKATSEEETEEESKKNMTS